MRKNTQILITIAFWLTIVPPVYAYGPIHISADACFSGMTAGGTYPIKITVENYGRSVDGEIDVQQESFGQSSHVYIYPINLPSGTVKELIAYPRVNAYTTAVDIDFDGPVHADTEELNVSPGETSQSGVTIGLVGSDVGSFQSIRSVGTADMNSTHYFDSYCNPADAPDNAVGYDSQRLLVIGEGAETLSEDQWSAIREYVVSGGSLLLLGGAGSLAYLQTEAGSELSPLGSLQQIDLSTLSFPSPSGMKSFSYVPIITGDLKQGAFVQQSDGSRPLLVSQHYGAGLVTLVTYNPLVQPICGIDGAPSILMSLVQNSLNNTTPLQLSLWLNVPFGEGGSVYTAGSIPYRSSAYGGGSIGTGFASESTSLEGNNPFQINLPPSGEVAVIFLVYFLLAIPISYGILKRIGRLEIAWFTTPVISILFAFVFYFFSASLYKASLTKRTAGVLTVAGGSANAHFQGSTEVFIPHGGSYNINIPNAESLEVTSPSPGNPYGSSSSTQSIETTDTVNGVAADGMNVGNLAFRRFYYDQPVTLGGAITSSITSDGNTLSGTVTNMTDLTLRHVTLTEISTKKSIQLGLLSPGSTVDLGKLPSCPLPGFLVMQGQSLANISEDKNAAYLVGSTNASPFGLQMGDDLSGADTIALETTLPIKELGHSK